MPNSNQNRSMRLSGAALRAAATLMETPGAALAVYQVATRQLGLPQLHDIVIPANTNIFRFLHLTPPRQGGDADG